MGLELLTGSISILLWCRVSLGSIPSVALINFSSPYKKWGSDSAIGAPESRNKEMNVLNMGSKVFLIDSYHQAWIKRGSEEHRSQEMTKKFDEIIPLM